MSRRRRAQAAEAQLPTPAPASEDAPVQPVVVFIPKALPLDEARAAWERFAAIVRRIAARP